MTPTRSKTIREVQRDRLRSQRGYKQQIASTTNDTVRRPIRNATRAAYDAMLREWQLFVAEYEGIPDPTCVKTAKDFVIFFSQGRQGRNEVDGPITVAYTHTAWRAFMAAWDRLHQVSFAHSLQETIANFIDGADDCGGTILELSTKARPLRNFTRDDFLLCVQQLWQHDGYDFVHERYRVGLHLLLLLHCNTSARRAEYEKVLRYSDVSVALVWLSENDQPQIVIDFRRSHAKGLQRHEREQPEHMLYELVRLPFYCNSVALFMAAALADGVFLHHDSWDSICSVTQPLQQKHLVLEYKPERCQWPLFPRGCRKAGLDRSRTSASLASRGLLDLGIRTGFRDPLTLHATRREVLLQVDNYGYSCNERMRFAAHINPSTYRHSYQTSLPTVDGQAAFFQLPVCGPELHALRRSYAWRRVGTARAQPTIITEPIVGETPLTHGEDNITTAEEVQSSLKRQQVYDRRRRRRRVSTPFDSDINAATISSSSNHKEVVCDEMCMATISPASSTTTQLPQDFVFCQTRRLMPRRDRLAESLFHEGSLRDVIGRTVMEDLIELCQEEQVPTYCKSLNSQVDVCDTCGRYCGKDCRPSWWRHLYHCRQRAARRRGSFADFCFWCFRWFEDPDEWQRHGREHLATMPLQCSMSIFRHNVVRPAWCPACLANNNFRQFLNISTWKRHLSQHLFALELSVCPHPRCRGQLQMQDPRSTLTHFATIHDIHLTETKRRALLKTMEKRSRSSKNVPKTLVFVDPSSAQFRSGTVRKLYSDGDEVINVSKKRRCLQWAANVNGNNQSVFEKRDWVEAEGSIGHQDES